jgi:hypothetical protein
MKIFTRSMDILCPIELFSIILTMIGLCFILTKEETETMKKFSNPKTTLANIFTITSKDWRIFNG